MNATLENMRKAEKDNAFAYSPYTGERYSANPWDYFWMDDQDVLEDLDGNPMILATESNSIIPL